MRKLIQGAVIALALLSVLVLAVPAIAAPVAWESVDVTLHNEQSPILLVSGTLPQSVKLPAQVELAVPTGSEFQWVGEILGGPAAQDPSVQYTVATKGDMDVYSFTLTKSRTAQLEVLTPAAIQFNGTQYMTAMKWTATQAAPKLIISARIPQGAQISTAAQGAQTVPGPTGYSYYQKTLTNVAVGDVVDLAFAYTVPAGATGAGGAAPGKSGDAVALTLVLAVFGGAFFVAARAVSRKMKPAVADDEEYEEYDEDEEEDDETLSPDDSYAFEDEDDEEQAEESAPPVVAKTKTNTSAKSTQKGGARTAASKKKGNASTRPIAENAPAPANKLDPRIMLGGVVVIALIAAGLIAGNSGTSAQLVDGAYQRNFGGTSICTSMQLGLTIPAGENPAKAADKIFAALEGQAGVGNVSIVPSTNIMTIEYCKTTNNEQALRSAVQASGYLDPSAPVAPAAPSAPATAPAGQL